MGNTQSSGRKWYARAAVLLGLTLALSVGVAPVAAQDDVEQTTVKFLAKLPGSAPADAWQQFVDAFEAQYPEINVELEVLEGLDATRNVLTSRMAGGEPPDLFTGDAGIAFMGGLVQNGFFRDLTDEYENRDWPLYEWTKPFLAYRGDGKVYSIADELHTIGMYYNKEIFNDLDLEVPATLEELDAVVTVLKEAGVTPMAFGNKPQWPAGHVWSMALSNALGTDGLNDIIFGEGSWDTPENVAALDLVFRQFVDDGIYNDAVNGLEYGDTQALFLQGNVAMWPTGSWVEAPISDAAEFEVGYAPFPTAGGPPFMPFGIGNEWYVSSTSENVEGALKLLDFATSEAGAQLRYDLWGNIPAHPLDISSLGAPPLAVGMFDQINTLAGAATPAVGYNMDVVTPASFVEEMFTGFQEVIGGNRTPEDMAAALQAVWETAKANKETLGTLGT
jgi:raffinose/stachyose/melibiose transport system substrate-binding protein